jgi:tetratricopeptide (TPR) repeat protein
MQGNPVEADSAFTKAQELAPACEIDITQYRQNNWAMLANAAIDFQKKGQADSAMALFRDANFLFRGRPHVPFNMGVLFANSNREDSAAVYFQTALALAERDTSLVEDRNAAALNLAVMYQRLNKHVEAISALHRYLTWRPDDKEAPKLLLGSFRAAGMVDSADALENQIVADLARGNPDSLSTEDLSTVGVGFFNAQQYRKAVVIFAKVARRSPRNREVLINLVLSNRNIGAVLRTGTLADSVKRHIGQPDSVAPGVPATSKEEIWLYGDDLVITMRQEKVTKFRLTGGFIDAAQSLVDQEPLNYQALLSLGYAFGFAGKDTSRMEAVEKLVALPMNLDLEEFRRLPEDAGVVFSWSVVGLLAPELSGRDSIKPAPMNLAFEFFNDSGAVLVRKVVTIPALAKDARHQFSIEARGAGIVGWRYSIK